MASKKTLQPIQQKVSRSTKKTEKIVTEPVKTSRKNSSNQKVSKVSISEDSAVTPKSKKLNFDKRVVWSLVGIILLIIAFYLANRYLVIAWVDGKPVTRIQVYSDLE